VEIKV